MRVVYEICVQMLLNWNFNRFVLFGQRRNCWGSKGGLKGNKVSEI